MHDTIPNASKDESSQSPTCSSPMKAPPKSLESNLIDRDLENEGSDNQLSIPTLWDRELAEIKTILHKIQENKIRVFEHILNPDGSLQNHSETIYLLYQVEVGHFLLPCSQFIGARNAEQACEMASQAMHLARESGHELLIAKCEYWMGRVEFLRGNFAAAHKHFVDAHACAMDPEDGVECLDLAFYHAVTRSGISDSTRAARLRAYERVVAAQYGKILPADVVAEKRKRPLMTWKDVCVDTQQPLIKQRPLGQIRKPWGRGSIVARIDAAQLTQDLGNDGSPGSLFGKILAEELGFDSPDFDGETATETSDKSLDNIDGLARTHSINGVASEVAVVSETTENTQRLTESSECPQEPFVFGVPHEDTEQTEFRLECFKIGLSQRSRPMTLFPKQPGEIVISPEEWKSMEDDARRTIVTYGYLARERYELMGVAEQM